LINKKIKGALRSGFPLLNFFLSSFRPAPFFPFPSQILKIGKKKAKKKKADDVEEIEVMDDANVNKTNRIIIIISSSSSN
jgi:hypothetical protein